MFGSFATQRRRNKGLIRKKENIVFLVSEIWPETMCRYPRCDVHGLVNQGVNCISHVILTFTKTSGTFKCLVIRKVSWPSCFPESCDGSAFIQPTEYTFQIDPRTWFDGRFEDRDSR